jgi:hypothetical protein
VLSTTKPPLPQSRISEAKKGFYTTEIKTISTNPFLSNFETKTKPATVLSITKPSWPM